MSGQASKDVRTSKIRNPSFIVRKLYQAINKRIFAPAHFAHHIVQLSSSSRPYPAAKHDIQHVEIIADYLVFVFPLITRRWLQKLINLRRKTDS